MNTIVTATPVSNDCRWIADPIWNDGRVIFGNRTVGSVTRGRENCIEGRRAMNDSRNENIRCGFGEIQRFARRLRNELINLLPSRFTNCLMVGTSWMIHEIVMRTKSPIATKKRITMITNCAINGNWCFDDGNGLRGFVTPFFIPQL